jgi:hypothetical protein
VLDRPTTIFETERLAFRRLTMDDLDALAAIFYGRYGFGLWATTSRETNELVGRSGLLPWTIEGRSEIEVAYLLAREHWGRGLGTEAARAVLDYGFDELSLSRLICLIDPANDASHQGGREDRHDPREGTRPGGRADSRVLGGSAARASLKYCSSGRSTRNGARRGPVPLWWEANPVCPRRNGAPRFAFSLRMRDVGVRRPRSAPRAELTASPVRG